MLEEKTLEPLAILGGTFDPVHYGHLRCAHEARRKLELDKLYLLPAGSPPHRSAPQASTRQRLDMLQLAVTEFPGLEIDQREILRHGPSYMVDTLRQLRDQYPIRPLLLLIGQDAANHLQSWHRWRDLFTLSHIVIMTRPGSGTVYGQEVAAEIEQRLTEHIQLLTSSRAGKVFKLEVSAIDISATGIKRKIHQGDSPKAMLPGTVLDYIHHNGLYLPRQS